MRKLKAKTIKKSKRILFFTCDPNFHFKYKETPGFLNIQKYPILPKVIRLQNYKKRLKLIKKNSFQVNLPKEGLDIKK
jgi:hypothetical protein